MKPLLLALFFSLIQARDASARSVMVVNCTPPKISPSCRPDVLEKIGPAMKSWGHFDYRCAKGFLWRVYPDNDAPLIKAPHQFVLANLPLFGIVHSTPAFNGGMQVFNDLFVEDRGAILWTGEDVKGRKQCSVLAAKLEDIPSDFSIRPRISKSEAISRAKILSHWKSREEDTTADARLSVRPQIDQEPASLIWTVFLRTTGSYELRRGIWIDAETGSERKFIQSDALMQPF